MGVKREIKRSRVYVSGSSSSSNDVSTSLPSPSSLPSASSSEVSSRGPPSPVFEHGKPFEGFPVVDLSLGEEVCEDDHVDTEAASSSAENSPAPTAAADDDAPYGVQDDSSGGGDEAGTP
jgi:hypothetical protein